MPLIQKGRTEQKREAERRERDNSSVVGMRLEHHFKRAKNDLVENSRVSSKEEHKFALRQHQTFQWWAIK